MSVYNLKDNDAYNSAIDFIYNLDNTTSNLDSYKINKLFLLFGYGSISDDFIDYLKNTIYNNDTLSKDNIKNYNLKNISYTDNDIDIFLSGFKNSDGYLDVDLYYATISKIFTNITEDTVKNELKKIYGATTTNYDMDTFKKYIKKLLL